MPGDGSLISEDTDSPVHVIAIPGLVGVASRGMTAMADSRCESKGTSIITNLATDPALRGVSGGYFSVNGARPLTPVAPAADPVLQAQLWESTALLLDTAPSG